MAVGKVEASMQGNDVSKGEKEDGKTRINILTGATCSLRVVEHALQLTGMLLSLFFFSFFLPWNENVFSFSFIVVSSVLVHHLRGRSAGENNTYAVLLLRFL